MKTEHIVIGIALAVGGYVVYKRTRPTVKPATTLGQQLGGFFSAAVDSIGAFSGLTSGSGAANGNGERPVDSAKRYVEPETGSPYVNRVASAAAFATPTKTVMR